MTVKMQNQYEATVQRLRETLDGYRRRNADLNRRLSEACMERDRAQAALAELTRAHGAQQREVVRLEAAKRQLIAELKTAYRRYDGPPVELWADSVRRELESRRAARRA